MTITLTKTITAVLATGMLATITMTALTPAQAFERGHRMERVGERGGWQRGRRHNRRRHNNDAAINLGLSLGLAIVGNAIANQAEKPVKDACYYYKRWQARLNAARAAHRRDLRMRASYGPQGASNATLNFDLAEIRRRQAKVRYWRNKCKGEPRWF